MMTDLFANTSIVKPSEIASWKDLLKPQYKGKIAAYDPRRSGPGQTPVGYLAALFGNSPFLADIVLAEPAFGRLDVEPSVRALCSELSDRPD